MYEPWEDLQTARKESLTISIKAYLENYESELQALPDLGSSGHAKFLISISEGLKSFLVEYGLKWTDISDSVIPVDIDPLCPLANSSHVHTTTL